MKFLTHIASVASGIALPKWAGLVGLGVGAMIILSFSIGYAAGQFKAFERNVRTAAFAAGRADCIAEQAAALEQMRAETAAMRAAIEERNEAALAAAAVEADGEITRLKKELANARQSDPVLDRCLSLPCRDGLCLDREGAAAGAGPG